MSIYDGTLIARADSYLDGVDVEELDGDTQSLVATYRAKREAGDERGAYAFARAIARRVDLDAYVSFADMKVAQLKAEIARRNEGRVDDELIVPEGGSKATKDQLVAALEADSAE